MGRVPPNLLYTFKHMSNLHRIYLKSNNEFNKNKSYTKTYT